MKIINRQPKETANISSARNTAGKELWHLLLMAAIALATLYLAVGFTVDFIVARISFETEAKIFNYKSYFSREQDTSHKRQLQSLTNILNKLKENQTVAALPYSLVLVENDEPNAFAFPGGTIGVTTELLNVLEDEIEIAFVLGHELGHFSNRDHLQGMGRALGIGIVMAILFQTGPGAESFSSAVDFVYQRSYSQKREKNADHFGIKLVYDTYGKVEGVDRLFRILRDEQGLPGWTYMFSTHPSPQTRIDDLKAYAAKMLNPP